MSIRSFMAGAFNRQFGWEAPNETAFICARGAQHDLSQYTDHPVDMTLSYARTGGVNDTAPAGITVADTGIVSVALGVPVGTYQMEVELSVAAALYPTDAITFSLPASLGEFIQGTTGQTNVSAYAADAMGHTPLHWSLVSGSGVAAGITVSDAGIVTVPNNAPPGTYTLGFSVTDGLDVVPAQVTGFVFGTVSRSSVPLLWDNVLTETGYRVERSPNNSTWTQIGSTAENGIAYTDSTVSPATLYYYRVRAYNLTGNGPYSLVISTVTPA